VVSFAVTWVVMATFWLALSGRFDAVHLGFGLASTTLVSALSHRLLFPPAAGGVSLGRLLRLFAFLPWLFKQILVANVDVLKRVLGARPVDPRIVRLRPDLHSEFGIVTLANSITLTPGTVTIEIEDGDFIVHAIAPEAVEGLLSRRMERKVQWVEGRPR
jgi:multicomponent Na+:H+ antiporter subunit E